ncbi:MAG TPA: pitrilysin family protein [Bryobacteraceae bacterium]|nr:pitrilysin family protein [Bryobacteraceae bacterium]
MRTILHSLIATAAMAVLAAPQEPAGAPGPAAQQSMKGVVRKRLAPVSNEVLHVKLPRPVEKKLKNGLPVLVIEKHKVPTVTLDLVLPASTLKDPAELPGVAEFTAEMMRLGTKTRSAKEIAETLTELGASLYLNAQYGTRTTHLYATALSENLDPLLDLMADVLLNPTFPQDELDKLKQRTLSRLQMMRSQEFFLGGERLHDVLYPDDARKISATTPDAVKKITRENLISFWKEHYRPGNSLLGVAGDVKPPALFDKLETRLARWESGTAVEPKLPLAAPIAEKKIYLINRPNSVQTFLLLANRAIDRMSPDYIPVQVMNRILGGGPTGRLFINLREEKGYTYGAYSSFAALKYLHHFQASSSVRTEVTEAAMREFLNEFRSIREKQVPKEEFEDAKRAIVASFALGLEQPASMLRQILLLREYGLPADYWDTYPTKVMAVTQADVQRVAQKYIPLDNVQVIAVGDAAKIRDVLAKFGPVEEYTAEGVRAKM